jgi:hypothetical protein
VKIFKLDNFSLTGYQRQLTYRHSDGSFSAFGPSTAKESGGTWLTAFVLRSFADTYKTGHIAMDERDVTMSLDMLLSTQNATDGCFSQVGAQLLSKALSGGLDTTASKNVGLSAYVLVSALKSLDALNRTSSPEYSAKIKSGFTCLIHSLFENANSLESTKTHTLGVVLYAFKLGGVYDEIVSKINAELEKRAKVESGFKYWTELKNETASQPHWIQSRSADLEITAYVLLAKLYKYQAQDLNDFVPVAKWINAQRNSLGGFYSTQDTVIALDALSEFSSAFYAKNISLRIIFSVTNSLIGSNKTFTSAVVINERNRLLTQVIKLENMVEKGVNLIRFRIEGQGTCLVQVDFVLYF